MRIEAVQHTVRDGDCISSLALRYGMAPKTIWDHPENSELAKARNRSVLQPGDVVHVPPQEEHSESCATEKRHSFERVGVPAMVRIRLLKNGKPFKGEKYTLDIRDGERLAGTTDDEGWLEHFIPPDAMEGVLVCDKGARRFELLFASLDPPETLKGVQARLQGMGLNPGQVDGKMNRTLSGAISEFQKAQGLKVTGEADKGTTDKLRSLFGA